MKVYEGKQIKVTIEAVIEGGRLIQLFPYGETNQEHCIHGIKLRWSCEKCEEETQHQSDDEMGAR